MKILLFIAFMAIYVTSNAQFLVGKTRNEVRTWAIKAGLYETSKNDSTLVFTKDYNSITFGFGKDDLCNFQIMLIDGSNFQYWYNVLSKNFGEPKAEYVENKIFEYVFYKNRYIQYSITAMESKSDVGFLIGSIRKND